MPEPAGETHPLFDPILEALRADSYLGDFTTVEPAMGVLAAHVAIEAIKASDYVVVRKDDLRAAVGAAGYYPWCEDIDDAVVRLQEALGDG